MRRLWHVLEVVAIYALKRLIDWFFTTKNEKSGPGSARNTAGAESG